MISRPVKATDSSGKNQSAGTRRVSALKRWEAACTRNDRPTPRSDNATTLHDSRMNPERDT